MPRHTIGPLPARVSVTTVTSSTVAHWRSGHSGPCNPCSGIPAPMGQRTHQPTLSGRIPTQHSPVQTSELLQYYNFMVISFLVFFFLMQRLILLICHLQVCPFSPFKSTSYIPHMKPCLPQKPCETLVVTSGSSLDRSCVCDFEG